MNKITTKLDITKDKEYFLPCTNCDGNTYHKVLYSIQKTESDDDIDVWTDHEVVYCQGCKGISFRKSTVCSEDIHFDPVTGEQLFTADIDLYPNRIAGRRQIKDMYLLPQQILKIYKETHNALSSQLNILAGIGIRTLTESVCKEKNTKGITLELKINDLVAKSVLTQDQAETLHKTRLLGNIAAHEIVAASDSDLDIAMDIVENIIKTVYIIPQKAKRLIKPT